MGVTVDQTRQGADTAKANTLVSKNKYPAWRTIDVLSEALPGLITKIYFPKPCTGPEKAALDSSVRFDGSWRSWAIEVVPFELAGVRSGDMTSGHRILGKPRIRVTIDNFADQLHDNGVVLVRSSAARDDRGRPRRQCASR